MDNSSRFARGMGRQQFHASAAPLTFSAQLIEHQLSPGEVKEASFTIYSQNEEGLEGEISSSQAFVRPVTRTFSGNAEEITYKVSAAAFDDGDTAEGFFRIISSQGEYTLPYQITVRQKELTSPIGIIENLNHFVSLARTNWKQRFSLLNQRLATVSYRDEPGLYSRLCSERALASVKIYSADRWAYIKELEKNRRNQPMLQSEFAQITELNKKPTFC